MRFLLAWDYTMIIPTLWRIYTPVFIPVGQRHSDVEKAAQATKEAGQRF